MRRNWVITIIVLLGVATAGWGYTFYRNQAANKKAAQEAAKNQAVQTEQENVIWASGKLEPVTWAALSPATAGTVSQIYVSEGDTITQGQLLAELDNDVLHSQVDIAAAAVAEAEAARAKLQAGATVAQMAAATANVTSAQAAVALAAGQMLEVQAAIDTAKAQVNIAQQQYNELASHPTPMEVEAAKAERAIAESVTSQAQAAYNVVRGNPQIGSLPESMKLREATAALEAAKAKYTLTTQGPTAEQLAVAASTLNAAKVQVNAAKSKTLSAEAAVKAALAQQASAQAAVDNLRAGATKEDLTMAEAHIQVARATLASAQATLRQSQIFAPFAGQVGSITVHIGELATPGQSLLLLGDTQHMHVSTTDLRETDVVRLSTDLSVEVTFDALPGRTFQGRLTKIAPVSTTEKGSTNYTVQVDVTDLDKSLRWGMTAFVNIQATRKVTPVNQ